METVRPRAAVPLSWGALLFAFGLLAFLLLPGTLVDKFYLVGFGICPQRPAHSNYLGGTALPGEASLRAALPILNALAPGTPTKLPVEARMFGMFAGFLLTWLYSFLTGRGRAALMPPAPVMFTYVAMIALMAWDGINATLYDLHGAGLPVPFLYAPRLDLRFVTGWLCGIALAGILLPVVNYCLWREPRSLPLFDRVRDLVPLWLAGAVILLLFLSGSGLWYYPLAVLAPLGILASLGALNTVLVLTLARRDRFALDWNAALNPLAVAVCLALLELGALSLVRWATFGLGELR